jgi:hypothetical protein
MKMEVELKSDWQEVQVELLKHLHGYEFKDLNDEIGCVDYVAEGEKDEKKLLRVIVGPTFQASRAFVKTVEDTLAQLEDDEYDEATLLAKSFTNASKRMVGEEEDLKMIASGESFHSITEIYGAIQSLTASICEIKCGGFPKTEEDCKGLVDGKYSCKARRVSDDADFHYRMGWLSLLMNDFSKLIELHRELDQ